MPSARHRIAIVVVTRALASERNAKRMSRRSESMAEPSNETAYADERFDSAGVPTV
jgi:hypothetical protein